MSVSIFSPCMRSGWNGKANKNDCWEVFGAAGRIYPLCSSKSRKMKARLMSKARRRNDKNIINADLNF